MVAVLLFRQKELVDDTYLKERVIWRLPTPVPGSLHPYKYRFFFGRSGHRIIGYDNERGKGDHRHVDGDEGPYRFVDLASLIADFNKDVDEWLSHKIEP